MLKRLTTLLFAMLLLLSAVSCGNSEQNGENTSSALTESEATTETEAATESAGDSDEPEVSTPLFWKVTGNGYDGDFYLLGSIHVGDESTNLYPPEITEAYDRCEYLAVECDIVSIEQNMFLMMEMLSELVYKDGTTIKDHIDPDVYTKARLILKKSGLYSQSLDDYMPVYWSTVIENVCVDASGMNYDYGVDRHFLTSAAEQGKEILEIEDAVESYRALGALSDATQEYMLFEATEDGYFAEYVASLRDMYSVWKKGDLDEMTNLLFEETDEELTAEELAIYEEYNDMMLTVRNPVMVDAAEDYIKADKDVFYIVGLAHMLGEDGIVNSLESLGYTVTLVDFAE